MQELNRLLKLAKSEYDRDRSPASEVQDVVVHALGRLSSQSTSRFLADCDGKPYSVFEADGRMTRPYLPSLFEADQDAFRLEWSALLASANPDQRKFALDSAAINRVLYTAMGAFACCYDLWKPASRKTPGTFFEVLLGTVLQRVLPTHRRARHVILPEQIENVSTDIVFHKEGGEVGGLVIPAKITTRERIVQVFAHQRILDSVFGEQVFRSTLVSMSEMQRDGDTNANAICVPGPIRMYQMHLASLSGIYYLDPPNRYLADDVSGVVPVKTVGVLLAEDLPALVA